MDVQISALAPTGPASGDHFWQIWFLRNFWPDFRIWQTSAQLQCMSINNG